MSPQAGRAKRGSGTREHPVLKTTPYQATDPVLGGGDVAFDCHNNPVQCISLSPIVLETGKQGLRESGGSGEGHNQVSG